jgi:hypothetical protein
MNHEEHEVHQGGSGSIFLSADDADLRRFFEAGDYGLKTAHLR